ncbi:metal-dependent hydrolase [Paenibacillus albiflavus]|uniref:Metal-dependent hydrolase n=1 Tax=Paenibacillus albiflavus TaxID=2545760 RepID=A0A4R4ECG9_9BACL|nr:metal-dependent hydrolase [Paenibacillus albiflavus]TCZ75861.1 metal-dependent hydrolase [Paenibacillus albiflavus]
MDSATHFVIGLGLAGLAHIDPVIANDSTAMVAVLFGTSIGSQIPDSDSVFRLKNNAAYIRMHRGISHSIPLLVIWTALITLTIMLFVHGLPFWHIAMWVGIAVFVHVFMDLFNTYGTQMLWPFSKKWISWNIIHIFDPFIFGTHVIAIVIWAIRWSEPAVIFPFLYILIGLYYIWRTLAHQVIERNLYHKDHTYLNGDKYYLIPTIQIGNWNIVKRRADASYQLGELKRGRLNWIDQVDCHQHPAVEQSKLHPDIQALLYFTSFACAEVREHDYGFEVRWVDVRYRHRKQYPFVAVLLMDHQYQTIGSYIGWLNEEKLEKKLGMNFQ